MYHLFYEAFSLREYNPEQAINLYNEELKLKPENLAALNNKDVLSFGKIVLDVGAVDLAVIVIT